MPKKAPQAAPKAPAADHFNKGRYDVAYKRANIVEKSVTFNRTKPDDVELLTWAETRPGSFNAYVKGLIRSDADAADTIPDPPDPDTPAGT